MERQSWNASEIVPLVPKDASDKGIAYQKDAPDDLKVVSWPPSKQAKDLKYYAYDRGGGRSVLLYVIEEGIDPQSSVSYP